MRGTKEYKLVKETNKKSINRARAAPRKAGRAPLPHGARRVSGDAALHLLHLAVEAVQINVDDAAARLVLHRLGSGCCGVLCALRARRKNRAARAARARAARARSAQRAAPISLHTTPLKPLKARL